MGKGTQINERGIFVQIIRGHLPRRAGNRDAVVRRTLDDVKRALTEIGREETWRLGQMMLDPERQQLESAVASVLTLGRVCKGITLMRKRTQELNLEEVVDQLEELAQDVARTIAEQTRCPQSAVARATLNRVAGQLHRAEAQLVPLLEQREITVAQEIVVPSDILYQAHRSLFPPERMLVVAGRQCEAGTLRLGATFDVTGNGPDTNHGHVRADPDKLGRALIAMDLSGTELGAWVHSHPGRGITATTPSSTDRQQHQDWIRDYSANLLSSIIVDDGYVRFWGSALESGQLEMRIVGAGVTEEETNVYRLAQG